MELAMVKEALVVGLGISGQAAAGKLLREGKQVVVNDLSISAPVEKAAAELARKGAKAALGHHDFTLLEGTDLVVVSPGVAGNLPLLTEARSRGIPVWSEIELAWRFARGPVIAVTGTNGKTTTVSMIESILKQAGRPAVAAGNIGFPLVKAVEEADAGDVLVVEVSSFQLAYIEDFRPDVAILLNIAEDHFDWHDHLGEYIEAKSRIWMNQREGDLVVTNLDDPLCVQAAARIPSRRAFFSKNAGGQAATYLKDGIIFSYIDNGGSQQSRPIIEMHDMKLVGEHNLENAMAAASAALVLGVSPEAVKLALKDFAGLEHRLQLVAETAGIKFYDDSKATNPHATMRALSAFEQPLILILGGEEQGPRFQGPRDRGGGKMECWRHSYRLRLRRGRPGDRAGFDGCLTAYRDQPASRTGGSLRGNIFQGVAGRCRTLQPRLCFLRSIRELHAERKTFPITGRPVQRRRGRSWLRKRLPGSPPERESGHRRPCWRRGAGRTWAGSNRRSAPRIKRSRLGIKRTLRARTQESDRKSAAKPHRRAERRPRDERR